MPSRQGIERKPPYASPLAFRDFLERTRPLPPPAQVDRNFLARLGIARNNEWSLTSALKFLGIIDDRGAPTSDYEQLQSDEWRTTLRSVVQRAYAPLLAHGGATMSLAELRNYFRVSGSNAQAQNAARFFRDLRGLAGIALPVSAPSGPPRDNSPSTPSPTADSAGRSDLLLRAKLRTLELLPPRPPDWTADEYLALFDRVLSVLKNLDETR